MLEVVARVLWPDHVLRKHQTLKSSKTEDLLIIFTKNPIAGKVKTRLAAEIGIQPALEIYRFLLKHTVSVTQNLNVDKRVYYSSQIEENDLWERKYFSKNIQQGKDLGIRMEIAFREAFRDNYKNVIIIGTDLLEIGKKDLEEAFQLLREKEVVIGPAKDGGYYLLGMNCMRSNLFRNKSWSTPAVFEETLHDLKNIDVGILESRNDIDDFKDIAGNPVFRKFLK